MSVTIEELTDVVQERMVDAALGWREEFAVDGYVSGYVFYNLRSDSLVLHVFVDARRCNPAYTFTVDGEDTPVLRLDAEIAMETLYPECPQITADVLVGEINRLLHFEFMSLQLGLDPQEFGKLNDV